CVLAQRLVRTICHHCKRPGKVTRALLEESGLDPALEHTHTFYEGIGCIECGGTGYKGRMAICELLDLTDRIREMILERRPTSEIKKTAREEGMRFLRETAPFPIEEGQVSFVPGVTAADGREFIVAVARRDVVAEYEALCAEAGAHAGLVDLSTFNVINAVLAGGAPSNDWLLVNIAAD